MTTKRITVEAYYTGNLLSKAREIETVMKRGYQSTTVYDNGMKKMTRTTHSVTDRFGKLEKGLNNVALKFVGLTALMSVAQRGTQKLVEWVGTSVDQFRQFENSMAEVSTILTGDTYSAISTLTSGVEEMSISFGKSAVDMSNALYQILSAAVEVNDALGLLNVATKASIAGLTSVETSVDVLTSILNSYGKEVSQAANVSDILFQTVVRGKLKFEDLASALGYITPIAASAGVAFEEVSAALATVTRMGLHVDMASRGLALAIQNIVSPTEQAKASADEFGVEMSAVGLRVFGLKGFVQDLNTAIAENGIRVLPRMIRNMRSLRVMIALASNEGLQGFKTDLDLVNTAAGRTDEALSKMIRTQQREYEIVKQSQEMINREIGETWAPIMRNVEATKLWFATWISSGLNIGRANKEISRLSETIQENRQEFYKSVEEMSADIKIPIFDQLMELDSFNPEALDRVLTSMVDMSKVYDYMSGMQDIQPMSELFGDVTKFEGASNTITHFMETLSDPKYRKDLSVGWWNTNKFTSKARQDIQNVMNLVADEFDDIEAPKLSFNIDEAKNQLQEFADNIDNNLTDTISTINDTRSEFDKLFGVIDAASENVFNMQTNILELQYTMEDLRAEVEDTYTTLAGFSHSGSLGLEIDTKSFDTAIDRMDSFVNMIKKYGTEFEKQFYDTFESATFSIGDEEISYIEEYDDNLKEHIKTINNYTEAQKEQEKVLNEVNKAILLNNIAIMELELKGMMRRRGNTRAEEQMMKKLRIANARERLKEKKAEVDAAKDIDKDAYEEAVDAVEEYFDRHQFTLKLMKDARDDELVHMKEVFAQKEFTLSRYNEALGIQERKLERAHQIELGVLTWIQENHPTIADSYEELYGISIPQAIQESIDAYEGWLNIQSGSTKPPPAIAEYTNPVTGIVNQPGPVDPGKVVDLFTNTRTRNLLSSITGHDNGIEYVPAEGLYHLHRGNRVLPSNSEGSGDTTINITVTGNTIADTNGDAIARQIADQVQKKLIDPRTGKTKYRMR